MVLYLYQRNTEQSPRVERNIDPVG
ncbi:hypothetical protein Goshw_025682 [Gossypium schwendimanii]|uniref:Uncharacterized protein n=1 Tax=Gossypium schwendimanii TaxID=34291 RepID=A0A7J9N7P6_GOSSC|nr:hypothetical protein [Gossypium schwendimanii]